MKKSSIISLIVIAVAVTVIISTSADASAYLSFDEAYELAENGKSNKIHVVGQLKKDANGKPTGIFAGPNKLSVSFVLVDNNMKEQTVYYNEPMPADLLRSEQVVVVGNYQNDRFIADRIVLKCPSKYEETEL
ncbi:MAG: cytochrome c maturation protein CcmE [Roseivirga sp.]|nr:cytochrome c maturation protein CcmE [Roseivirga sp.]